MKIRNTLEASEDEKYLKTGEYEKLEEKCT